MGFLPWAMADSHFFERERFGRLVAALEASGRRLGIGVGEGACVEIDLATGEAIGVTEAESLLVDVSGLQRSGLTRRNIRTRLISEGMQVSLVERPPVPPAPPLPPALSDVARADSGPARRSASRQFFAEVQRSRDTGWRLQLDGYQQIGWPAGEGAVVELRAD
jgi:hypothetical protein